MHFLHCYTVTSTNSLLLMVMELGELLHEDKNGGCQFLSPFWGIMLSLLIFSGG